MRKKKEEKEPSVFLGGVAVPLGDFADESSGCVKTGYCIGMQYVSSGQIGFLINISYISNPAQYDAGSAFSYNSEGSIDRWITIPVLCGLKIGASNSEGINLFFAPVIGFCIAKCCLSLSSG